jgi:hypothetical protein
MNDLTKNTDDHRHSMNVLLFTLRRSIADTVARSHNGRESAMSSMQWFDRVVLRAIGLLMLEQCNQARMLQAAQHIAETVTRYVAIVVLTVFALRMIVRLCFRMRQGSSAIVSLLVLELWRGRLRYGNTVE